MVKTRWFVRGSTFLVIAALLLQVTSCGTLLYPERRGQETGHLDVGIVLLDGIGLLFFLIPGIVAYAVDLSTGAIYLPPGEAKAVPPTLDPEEMTVVRMDPERMDRQSIERAIEERLSRDIDLDSGDLQVYEIDENGRFVPRNPSKPIPYAMSDES
jgi:hypothetical protein